MARLQFWLSSGRWPVRVGLLLLATSSLAQAQDGLPAGTDDPAFDRYVDLGLLSGAWEEKNAGLLTDVALQLAEGERVLLRPHKGITSDQVFAAALRVAAERKDKVALVRLNKAFAALGKTELAGEAKLAGLLADKSRAVDPALNVPVEGTPAEVFLLLQDTVEAIKSTKLGQNSKGLDAIIMEIPKMPELSEGQRKALLKLAKDAQANMPKEAKEVDPLVAALNKLSGEARSGPRSGGAAHPHPGGGGAAHPQKGTGTGSSHPGGGAAAGSRPGGGAAVGSRPAGGGSRANRANAPRRIVNIQGNWQRRFSPRYNCYVYWDPNYGCYYFYDQGCSCYAMLDDGDDDGDN